MKYEDYNKVLKLLNGAHNELSDGGDHTNAQRLTHFIQDLRLLRDVKENLKDE